MKIKNSITISKRLTKFAILGALAVTSFSTTSCKKWLEEKPYSLYASETYYKNVDDATKAVLGVYEIMSNQKAFVCYMSIVFDIDSDVADLEGTGFSKDKRTLAPYSFATSHNYTARACRELYNCVNGANSVI